MVDFTDTIPAYLNNQKPILISGSNSLKFDGIEYLVINNNLTDLYEIRYQYHCSPFKEAIIVNTMLAVGHEEHFYLFDKSTNTNLLTLKMDGYFGHLYVNDNQFYITDASGIYCIDTTGIILWKNNNLAVDGVIINDFLDNTILGSGEWDPPGGWQDFVIDRQTGILFK